MGVLAANGTGSEAFWSSILEGRSGIDTITAFDPGGLRSRIAGEVTDFDPLAYIDPALKPRRRMGRATQLGIAAAKLALEEAAFDAATLERAGEVPLVMGVSSSALELREKPAASWIAVMSIPHIVGSMIAFTQGLNTRLLTVSTGCASGLDAVWLAADEIRRGKAEIAIAGAADSVMSRYVFECFCKSRKLSEYNDEPQRASRPFDRTRGGGVAAEGAGVVVLESLEHAVARGAEPYGEITGYANSADPPQPVEGLGMETAMRMALANAARRPDQVDFINAHGPSDQHMDAIETTLIKKVLGEHAYRTPVSSIKGITGNPMGVGCMHQLIASALTLRHNVVTPTANWEERDPECDLDYVPNTPRELACDIIMINTHGFGRGNGSLVLERIP
jgi:3-oxoacyl-[acyl-carrier-protein] synthase II